jgi:outer membrane protease
MALKFGVDLSFDRTQVSNTPELFGGVYSYSVFKSLSITFQCPANLKVIGKKKEIRVLHMGPRTHKGDFLENGCYDFD